ncbi:13381_t:CDS:1, partial [Gigaspora rosea]
LEIEDHIERRCAIIENDQKKMLRSLLNKPWKSIKLDHIFEQDGVDRNPITEEEAVLEKTMLHFQQQFRKRRTHLISMSNEW